MHKYTDAERQFLKIYVPGHSYKEIQQEFIKTFLWNISLWQIKGYIQNNNISTGRTGHFEKGHIPANKGLKGISYPGSVATQFKAGHMPHNYVPVGTEVLTKDGYIRIKTADPCTWKLKHRYVWEQHNGKIPDGYALVFKDGNIQNCDIDNLILITRRKLLILNRNHLLQQDVNINKNAMAIADLMMKITDRSRK